MTSTNSPTSPFLPFLSERIHSTLTNKMGISDLFDMQKSVISAILGFENPTTESSDSGAFAPLLGDVMVCAPTGSGKTLSYSIPIVHILEQKQITTLRALILVPTVELAAQAYTVLQQLCSGTNISVALISGKTSFKEDQRHLIGQTLDLKSRLKRFRSDSISPANPATSRSFCTFPPPASVDILVATPGRLVDHLDYTPGFSLASLQLLVLDEADRLLMSYADWLPKLAAHLPSDSPDVLPVPSYRGSQLVPALSLLTGISRVRKLMFSATMTRNPEHLAMLQLQAPTVLSFTASAAAKYSLPPTLQQYVVKLKQSGIGAEQPLALVLLIDRILNSGKEEPRVLVFAPSVEAAHRIALLLAGMKLEAVRDFSASLSLKQRAAILRDFKTGAIKVLICSDLMARGLDLSGITDVINYGPPPYLRTYIHRVGRTARAGRPGDAYTILRHDQLFYFQKLFTKSKLPIPEKYPFHESSLKSFRKPYEHSLAQLKKKNDSINQLN